MSQSRLYQSMEANDYQLTPYYQRQIYDDLINPVQLLMITYFVEPVEKTQEYSCMQTIITMKRELMECKKQLANQHKEIITMQTNTNILTEQYQELQSINEKNNKKIDYLTKQTNKTIIKQNDINKDVQCELRYTEELTQEQLLKYDKIKNLSHHALKQQVNQLKNLVKEKEEGH